MHVFIKTRWINTNKVVNKLKRDLHTRKVIKRGICETRECFRIITTDFEVVCNRSVRSSFNRLSVDQFRSSVSCSIVMGTTSAIYEITLSNLTHGFTISVVLEYFKWLISLYWIKTHFTEMFLVLPSLLKRLSRFSYSAYYGRQS